TTESDIRDRFLFDRGYTVAWIGWQFDVRPEPNRVRLYAPVAPGITGKVRSDFVVAEKVEVHTVGHVISGAIGGTGYPSATMEGKSLTRSMRTSPALGAAISINDSRSRRAMPSRCHRCFIVLISFRSPICRLPIR